MKKNIVSIIGMTVVLFALAGCTTVKPEPQGELVGVAPKEMTVHPIVLSDLKYIDEKLFFTIENNSIEDATYGEAYRIDVSQEDLTWKDSEMTTGMSFIEIAHIIPAGSKNENSVDLSGLEFKEGQYRVVRDYHINSETYEVGVDFNVLDTELEDLKLTPTVGTVSLK